MERVAQRLSGRPLIYCVFNKIRFTYFPKHATRKRFVDNYYFELCYKRFKFLLLKNQA